MGSSVKLCPAKAFVLAIMLALTCGFSSNAAMAQAVATTTNLAVTPAGPVSSGTVVTLTASVVAGSTPVAPGRVIFCDSSATSCSGLAVLGTAQLTGTGTAVLKFVPGIGTHDYKAVFAGTTTYSSSRATAPTLTVNGPYSTMTTISSSGSIGDYTLTGTVVGTGSFLAPTGNVSFLDTTNSNSSLGAVALGAATFAQSFVNGPTSPIAVGTNNPLFVAVGDFNSDGIQDLAVSSYGWSGSGTVSILLGNGSGDFAPATGSPIAVGGNNPWFVAVGDFNSDGIQDLVTANYDSSTVSILLGNGSGAFTPATGSPIAVGGNNPWFVAVGDFNGDGIQDFATANQTGTVSILLGKGDGTFAPATGSPIVMGTDPRSVAVGDFNGDGIADLAVTSWSGTVSILLGKGDGTFAPATGSPITVGAWSWSVVVGDFNGDGIADLAVTGGSSGTVSILLGNGNGGFAPATGSPITVGTRAFPVAVEDFNGDGIADLAVTNDDFAGTLSILLGKGDGTFAPATGSPITVGTTPLSVAVGDFNGDGINDLTVINDAPGTVNILLNQVTQTATASLTGVNVPSTGTHNVDATYAGDTNFATSTSSTTPLTASPAATTLALTAAPTQSAYGQQVVLAATLSPSTIGGLTTNGETVTFYNGATPLGTGTLSTGVATLNITSLPVGTLSLTASYVADTNFLGSTSPALSYTVNKAPLGSRGAPASSQNPALADQPVTFTATLPNGATGTVTFDADGVAIASCTGMTISGTVATCTTSSLTPGTHEITWVYSGDSNYNGATSAALHQVIKKIVPTSGRGAPASSQNPALADQPVTFTATLPNGATGTVTFDADGVAIASCTGMTISGTVATCTTSSLTPGTHEITWVYSGDSNYNGATSAALHQVIKKIVPTSGRGAPASSQNPALADQPVTFTATLPNGATGTVTFDADGVAIASCTGMTISGTVATCTTSSLTPGTHEITWVYSGDSNYNGATSAALHQVIKKIVPTSGRGAPASSQNPALADQPVTFTATLPNGATGTVTFDADGVAIASCTGMTISGTVATCTTSSLTPGTHEITWVYSGDSNYNGATSAALHQVIKKIVPTSGRGAPASSQNPALADQPVTFTATLPNGATGTVTFDADGVAIASCTGMTISGTVATCTTSSLTLGTHEITAAYSGDSKNSSSTSGVLSQVVANTVLLNPTSGTTNQTVTPGTSVTYGFTFTPPAGNNAPTGITFTYSSSPALPAGYQITVTPRRLAAGANTQTVSLQITPVQVASDSGRRSPWPLSGGAAALALTLLPLSLSRRRLVGRKLLLLVLAVAATVAGAGLVGCGSGVVPQHYNITVTASPDGVPTETLQTSTVTLNVQ